MAFDKELLQKMGFSNKAITYLTTNKNVGRMSEPTVTGVYTGTCSDTIIIYLKIKDNIIIDASFIYTGCVGSATTGSAITELVKGLSVSEAWNLDLNSIIEFYKEGDKSIPKVKYECGEIAVNSLRSALLNYIIRNDEAVILTTSNDDNINSMVSNHFGRAPYFIKTIIIKGEIKSNEAIKNEYAVNHNPIELIRSIIKQRPKAIITKGIGGRAIERLTKNKVLVIITNEELTVNEAINKLIIGDLNGNQACNK